MVAIYTMTSGNETYPDVTLMDWVGSKLVENGWQYVEELNVTHNEFPTGTATGGSTTSLTDSSKNWVVNEHVGKIILKTGGTGQSTAWHTITANTATQVTVSSWAGGTPASGTTYLIITPKASVYKSPSPLNGLPSDFYVTLVSRCSGMYSCRVALHELYTTGTKVRDKFAPANLSTSSGFTINSDFSANGFTTAYSIAAASGHSYYYTYTGATFTWILLVDASHFILGRTNGATNSGPYVLYAGAFDSFLSSSLDPMPLVNSSFGSAGSYGNAPAYTRDPGILAPELAGGSAWKDIYPSIGGSINTATTSFYAYGAVNGTSPRAATSGGSGSYAGVNPFTQANGGAQKILCRSGRNTGFPRGTYKDALISAQGVLPGQTMNVTIGGQVKQYILVQASGSGSGSNWLNVWLPTGA